MRCSTSHDGTEALVSAFRMGGDERQKQLRLKGLRSGHPHRIRELLEDGASMAYPPDALQESGLPVVPGRDHGRLFHVPESA